MARTKRQDTHAAEILERQQLALELRRDGMSYRKIGDRLKVSHVQARADVEGALQLLANENRDSAELVRQLELERLDFVTHSYTHWIQAGSAQAGNTYLRAMERRAKLLGLDAPQTLNVNINMALVIELVEVLQAAGLDPSDTFQAMIQQARARANQNAR